jgi:two-component system response regulator HydG
VEQARLLVGDDDRGVRETLVEILSRPGHHVDAVASGDQLLARVRSQSYDMVLCDLQFPPTDGIALLREVKRLQPKALVVIFTGHATVTTALDAFRSGAFDVVEKPVPVERLLDLARRATEVREMGRKRQSLAEELESERLEVLRLRQQLAADDPFQRLIGCSSVMHALVETLREIARTDCTVLLTGESGTGKGLVARTLHEASARREAPFVEANCVVYAEGVLHSELFGHERGAFTGADRVKRGRFELARGGTLFLDEIGEISPATQLLLLRVLQERTFERVGGEETLEADVRLVAATNRDLPQAVRQGSFRSDLFYRLNVIPVQIPPLREREEDIPLLVEHFAASIRARSGREIEGFSEEAMTALVRYPWPGNVRELENLIERIVVMNRDKTVGYRDLPATLREAARRGEPVDETGTLAELERSRIIEALREAVGNKKLAATRLGIHRSTLYAKMRRHGLLGDAAGVASIPERRD